MANFIDTEDRCIKLAQYLIENNTTVRKTAQYFCISKSTVHKDITTKLKKINKSLYCDVEKILQHNKQERHLRGGEATKRKFKKIKE